MSVADFLVDAIRFVSDAIRDHWPSLLGIAAAFALRRRILRLPLPRLRDWQACALVVALSLASSLGAAALRNVPPQFHDDYAHLLIADTFAHGRLANPPHPLSDFFETMHVLQRPSYTGKFFPGEGAVLFLGMRLFGQPLAAVWLLSAAACAAIWWALRGWLSPELALLGGVLAAIHPTMLTYAMSYQGGALAALGGALLLGGAARSAALPAGIGIALLAYSRPYEGLVLTIAIAVAMRLRLLRAIPIAVVALVPLAIYNRAATGSAFVLPYTIYEQRYNPTPRFFWESLHPVPPEPNLEMATAYRVAYVGHLRRVHSPGGVRDEIVKKFAVIARTLFGPPLLLLLVPLAALPAALKKDARARRLALALLLFAFAPFSFLGWLMMHYLAPAAAVAAALMVLLVAELPPSFAVAVLIAFVVNAGAGWFGFVRTPDVGREKERQAIAASVDGVVLVAPNVFDLVYNGADIDHQRVIWARDLGPARNAALRAYYRGRKFWAIDESSGRARLRPLP